MSDREAFEKWYRAEFKREPCPDYGYESDITWQAWQAARATDAEPLAWWDGDYGEAETAFQFHQDHIYSEPVYTHPPAKPESQEASLFWDANDTEMSHENEQELADYAAQDLPFGESMTVDVISAKKLPHRQMKVWIDSDDDVQWDWIPTNQESGE